MTDYTEKVAAEVRADYSLVVDAALLGDVDSLDLLLQSAVSRGYALGFGVAS